MLVVPTPIASGKGEQRKDLVVDATSLLCTLDV